MAPRPELQSYIRLNHVVDQDTGCWLWTGKLRHGYGKIKIPNIGKFAAHRLAYEAYVDEIPDGMFICHKCDNRSCVNPEHLFVGSARDNINDMFAKDRSGNQKLSAANIREMQELHRNSGLSIAELSKKYNVTRQHVVLVLKATPETSKRLARRD